MQVDRFVEERSAAWGDLAALLERAKGQPDRLAPEEIHRLGALYRAAAADLALASRSWPDAAGTLRLHGLVVAANQLVYAKAAKRDTIAEYFGRRLWQQIRQLHGCLALAAAVLFGSLALGALWAAVEPSAAAGLLPAGFQVAAHTRGGFYGTAIAGRGGLVWFIWVNNLRVAVLAMAGGFTGGVVTAWFLAYNGALIGVLGAFEWRVGGFESFLSLTVPHGLLELSCVTIAGGIGFLIAKALIDPGTDTRAEALQRCTPVVGSAIASVILFLLVAATTEGIITPWDLPTPAALAVGVALAGTFWTLVGWRGRPTAHVHPESVNGRRGRPARLPRDGLSASV
ncbi:MAG: stage II sporulation protein M [Acidimicrobiales bacterium]